MARAAAAPAGRGPDTDQRNGSPRVSTPTSDRITSPWVMGGIAALGALAVGLGVCIVPALAAQLSASTSSLSVLGAVLLGIDAFVLGHGGSLVITGGAVPGAVSIPPLGLMLVLLVVTSSPMRRMGRALDLVTAEGVLRTRAVRDAGAALAAFVLVYGAGGFLVASVGRSDLVEPVAPSAALACAVVAVLGGVIGLLGGMRASGARLGARVRALDLLPTPYDAIARATGIAVLTLLVGALLVTLVMVGLGAGRIGALWSELDPGLVGGIVLALVQLALLPLFVVWTLAVLVGGTFTVGTGTAVSLSGSQTGLMPALPLLGAMPAPGAAPGAVWALLAVPVLAVGLGAVRLARDVSGRDVRTRVLSWCVYAAGLVVVVLLLLGLSIGGIGTGRLAVLGPDVLSALPVLAGIVVGTTALVAIALDTPLTGWVRGQWSRLRTRVEHAEAVEAGDVPEGGVAGRRGVSPSTDRPDTSRTSDASRASEDHVGSDDAIGSESSDAAARDAWDIDPVSRPQDAGASRSPAATRARDRPSDPRP